MITKNKIGNGGAIKSFFYQSSSQLAGRFGTTLFGNVFLQLKKYSDHWDAAGKNLKVNKNEIL